jgi:hypothetical protein
VYGIVLILFIGCSEKYKSVETENKLVFAREYAGRELIINEHEKILEGFYILYYK